MILDYCTQVYFTVCYPCPLLLSHPPDLLAVLTILILKFLLFLPPCSHSSYSSPLSAPTQSPLSSTLQGRKPEPPFRTVRTLPYLRPLPRKPSQPKYNVRAMSHYYSVILHQSIYFDIFTSDIISGDGDCELFNLLFVHTLFLPDTTP